MIIFLNEYLAITILDLCYHASLIGHLPFYFQDLISNSPYCLPNNTYDVNLENLMLDQLIIPFW